MDHGRLPPALLCRTDMLDTEDLESGERKRAELQPIPGPGAVLSDLSGYRRLSLAQEPSDIDSSSALPAGTQYRRHDWNHCYADHPTYQKEAVARSYQAKVFQTFTNYVHPLCLR